MPARLAICSVLWCGVTSASVLHAQQQEATVPFIGCSSDGQLGPVDAPKGQTARIKLPISVASRVAFYKAEEGPGVLAPRGWFCFGTYGSSGSSLFVTPTPIAPKMLFSETWKGFTGAVIQLSYELGGTSGRFGVAAAIARVFPNYRHFITAIQSEGFDPSTTSFSTVRTRLTSCTT